MLLGARLDSAARESQRKGKKIDRSTQCSLTVGFIHPGSTDCHLFTAEWGAFFCFLEDRSSLCCCRNPSRESLRKSRPDYDRKRRLLGLVGPSGSDGGPRAEGGALPGLLSRARPDLLQLKLELGAWGPAPGLVI